MKHKWLQKNNNSRLIIFFNGWGMDENAISHLDCEDFDVVVLYDYNDLDIKLSLDNYQEKHILAWSMGVGIAATEYPCIKTIINGYKSATAICGTPYPINDSYGIPKRIYDLTVKGFNEKSSAKFIERMFDKKENIFPVTNRSFESQKSELIKMLDYDFNSDFKYTKAIIPNNDLIIPTKNQKAFWDNTNTKTEIINSGHYPFLLYNKFSELI